MAFVHHTMLTAENLRGLPSKQLHTNVEPHYSPRSRAAPTAMWGGGSGRCLFEACDWRTFLPTIRISLLNGSLGINGYFCCSSLFALRSSR